MNVPHVKRFLQQLKERKVIRVGIAYIIVGWIMMQVGEVTFEALPLPPWTLTLLVVTILLGFPIALVLAWAFEVTPQGICPHSNAIWRDTTTEENSLQASVVVGRA